jgi:hypothetical protein
MVAVVLAVSSGFLCEENDERCCSDVSHDKAMQKALEQAYDHLLAQVAFVVAATRHLTADAVKGIDCGGSFWLVDSTGRRPFWWPRIDAGVLLSFFVCLLQVCCFLCLFVYCCCLLFTLP